MGSNFSTIIGGPEKYSAGKSKLHCPTPNGSIPLLFVHFTVKFGFMSSCCSCANTEKKCKRVNAKENAAQVQQGNKVENGKRKK